MATTEIKDFRDGLDTRRPAIVGQEGSLIEAVNVNITRGGDVESCKAFVPFFLFASTVFGFHPANNKIYVFGSAAAPTILPGIIVYQQLLNPLNSAIAMKDILDVANFSGKIYAIAEFVDGTIAHYYDTAQVTDWDTEAALVAANDTVAQYLADKIDALSEVEAAVDGVIITITGAVAGVAFTISKAVSGGTITLATPQAAVAATPETRASGTFTITGGSAAPGDSISHIYAGATDLMGGVPVPFILNFASTALQCVININALTSVHGYTASSSGAVVTIQAAVGTGAGPNSITLSVTVTGAMTVGSVSGFSGGVTAVPAIAQVSTAAIGGSFAGSNTYQITINSDVTLITGLSSGYGRILKTFLGTMHSAVSALDINSAIEDPTSWTTGTGINTLNISSNDDGSQELTAYAIWLGKLCMFSKDTIQIWAINADPTDNTFSQLVQNTGTRSPKSVIGYGSSDVLYLDQRGVRSLRANAVASAAYTDDIGTKVDNDVIAFMATLTDAQIEAAITVCDPIDGRAWMAIYNQIYVFSYFPNAKVSAWSKYQPGFEIDGMCVANRQIYILSGRQVYQVGGSTNNQFPNPGDNPVRVRLPFISANRSAEQKRVKGVDIICGGEWTIQLLVNPKDETQMTAPITVSGPTGLIGQIAIEAETTHFAPLLTSSAGGDLTLSSVLIHFDDGETS